MKKLIHILLKIITIGIILFFTFFEFTNNLKYNITPSYSQSFTTIDSVLKIGYSQQNITPKEPVTMVGYGFRDDFEGVHDSIYVRSILLENGGKKVAIISYDLMLVTPEISSRVEILAKQIGIDEVYFSATHTHSSFGGLGNSLVGRFVLGNYNQNIINYMVEKTKLSLQHCNTHLEKVGSASYHKKPFSNIKNRVTKERNINDFLRNIVFKIDDGTSICIISSNAHPTIIDHNQVLLSNDYPGEICKQDTSDFTLFLASTMGNLTPIIHQGKTDFERAEKFAEMLLKGGEITSEKVSFHKFSYSSVDFNIINYGIHISENIKLRKWAFRFLVGEPSSHISVLRLGNLMFISLPIELSAEYYPELELLAKKKNLYLFITTFNGNYVGYGTKPNQFSINHMETREMNWLGKYGGDYFKEVIQKIIEKQ